MQQYQAKEQVTMLQDSKPDAEASDYFSVDQTPSAIPFGYSITSYILIVEERWCETCNSVHSAPSSSLRVKLIHHRTKAMKTISLPDLKKFYTTLPSSIRKEFNNPVLPREIHTVQTSTPFCQCCFHTCTSEQPDLFKPERQLLTPAQIAHLRNISQQLVEEYGREPTAEELKAAAKTRKASQTTTTSAAQPKKTAKILDLSKFM